MSAAAGSIPACAAYKERVRATHVRLAFHIFRTRVVYFMVNLQAALKIAQFSDPAC